MTAPVLTPTAQQQAILDAAATGEDVKIIAGAGSGKSSTLRLIAVDMERRGQTGIYIAFNKAVAAEAKATFPRNVQAATAHSLAYRAVQQTATGPALLAKLKARKVPLNVTVKRMNITGTTITTNDGARRLSAYEVARIAADTVKLFCQSADRFIVRTHLPVVVGFGDGKVRGDGHDELATHIGPIARRMWADIIDPTGDSTQFSHDAYLKLWSMSDPVLPGPGVLLIDEAQDLNPAVAVVVARQRVDGDPHRSLQRIVVGDDYQAIYGFNGSRDYLGAFQAPHVLALTKSWRFGPAVADAANRVLAKLRAPLRIEGNDAVTSRIVPGYAEPTDGSVVGAILCRTNAGAVGEAIQASARGHRVFLRAGKAEMTSFIDSAEALRLGGLPKHPDLQVFGSWAEVIEYVDLDPNGGDLKVRVKLVEDYGIQVLRQALARCVDDETQATCVASTAHTMKGLEYPWVIVGADFDRGDDDERPPSDEELMLAYVSVTRAKNILDPGGLSRLLGFEKPGVATPVVVAAAVAGPGTPDPAPAPVVPAADPLVVTIEGDLANQLRDLFGDDAQGRTITLMGAALQSALRQVSGRPVRPAACLDLTGGITPATGRELPPVGDGGIGPQCRHLNDPTPSPT